MLFQLFLLLSAGIYWLYRWATKYYNTFEERGIPYEKPLPLVGNALSLALNKESSLLMILKLYRRTKTYPIYGYYNFRQPVFVINDPELIKKIAIKDFDHFPNHTSFFGGNNDKLLGNMLTMMKDQRWKDMRNTLSPVFTASKMRTMFTLMNDCFDESLNYIRGEAKSGGGAAELEMKQCFTRLSNDIIASTAFGLKINSYVDANNEFYNIGQSVTAFKGAQMFKFLMATVIPDITNLLGIKILNQDQTAYFIRLVVDTMNYREKNKIVRPDMIQLLMEAKKESVQKWTDEELVSQCFIFFFAAFENNANLICTTCYELAMNPDVQQRLHEEITELKEQLNGAKLSYDDVNKMQYMDMVVSETLRKWSLASLTDRLCSRDYTLRDDDGKAIFDFKAGDNLWFPIAGLQRDEAYFESPEVFGPERFSDENKHRIKQSTYMPFGLGPRNCIDFQSFWITSWCSSELKRNRNQYQRQQQQHQILQRKRRPTQRFQRDIFLLQQNYPNHCSHYQEQKEQQQHNANCGIECYHHNHYQQQQQQHWQLQQEQLQQQQIKQNYYNKEEIQNQGHNLFEPNADLRIIETKFISNTTDNTMDDMVYQYNNQNSIYVLNSSLNSYEEFGRLNLVACPQLNPITNVDRNSNNCQQSQMSAMTGNTNNSNNCSTVSRTLQHKLKTLGTFNATEGIGNPVASSMSSSIGTCSPAAAALQKLFNCSSNVVASNNINSCNNSHHNNSCIGGNSSCSNNSNIIRDCLSATETDNSVDTGAMLCNGNSSTSSSSTSNSNNNNNNNNNSSKGKKKCTNVKSTLIAKKTKFWKYLEEEKWRTHDSIENLSTTNCERNRDNTSMNSSAASFAFYDNSLGNNSTTTTSSSTSSSSPLSSSTAAVAVAASATSASSAIVGPLSYNNHYASNITTHQQQQQQQRREQEQPQYKLNNWSGNHDSNNQKQLKSSSELYKEAAELLGLSCTLCDNCRCLDCQSGYFDCDDSDSYSEYSLMDEYDEITTVGCLMQSDYDYDDNATAAYAEQQQQQVQQQQQQQHQQVDDQRHSNIAPHCKVTTCNIEVCGIENMTNVNAATTATTAKANISKHEHDFDDVDVDVDVAIATDDGLIANAATSVKVITPTHSKMIHHQLSDVNCGNSCILTQPLLTSATSAIEDAQNQYQQQQWRRQHQINELENCASFNELSLMDVKTKNVEHQGRQQQQQQLQVLMQNQQVPCDVNIK